MTSTDLESTGRRGTFPRWPLFLIASPAAVAVWSGWVGLGGLCGFGVIHPLPGIWDGLKLDTAITLPIGVEAYGSYALGAWLTNGDVPAQAREFAKWSAIGALALGMTGQVIYHLLAAAHAHRAPWPVVVLVSCLPVVTLGFGAALAHLLCTPARTGERSRTDASLHADSRTEPGPRTVRTDPNDPYGPDGRTGGHRDVDRDALVAELAAEILAAAAAGEKWRPDYGALMARTGFKRSWCEKAVRDARKAVFRTERTARTDGPRTPPLPGPGSGAGLSPDTPDSGTPAGVPA